MLYSRWKNLHPLVRRLIPLALFLVAGFVAVYWARERLWVRLDKAEARAVRPVRLTDDYDVYRALSGDVLAYSKADDVCYIVRDNRRVVALKADEVTRDWGAVVFTWHGWSDVAHIATGGESTP